jgi:hypothetical protein
MSSISQIDPAKLQEEGREHLLKDNKVHLQVYCEQILHKFRAKKTSIPKLVTLIHYKSRTFPFAGSHLLDYTLVNYMR